MPKDWKPDVRASAYQTLCDQMSLDPEIMNDELDFEKELVNGAGNRMQVFEALCSRFDVDHNELEYSPDLRITTVGQLVDYIHERF